MPLHHLCIQTNCYAASLKFYMEALSMQILRETKNFHGRAYNAWLSGDGFCVELQTPKANGVFLPAEAAVHAGIAHFCLLVDDLDELYACLSARDDIVFHKKNDRPMYEVNGRRLMKISAPEGTIIEFRDSEID